MMSKTSILKNMARIASVALSAVFIISSVAKLINFYDTQNYFLDFRFVSPFAALFLTSLLVSFELCLGIALIAERNPARPLLMCAGAFVVFTIYQIIIMLFPATFTRTCPCFGASEMITSLDPLPLIRNFVLVIVTILCYIFYKRQTVIHDMASSRKAERIHALFKR